MSKHAFHPTASKKNLALAYAAFIPIPGLSIYAMKFMGITDFVHATSFGTAVATVLDGTALVWWPSLYGDTKDHTKAGAFILFAAGAGLFWSFVFQQ